MFGGASKVTFTNNKALDGGAIFSDLDVTFSENSTATFTYNKTDNGGVLC